MLWDICGRDTADTFTGQVYKSLETLPHNLHYLTPILAGGKEEVNIFIFVFFVVVVFLKGTGKNCALNPAELY